MSRAIIKIAAAASGMTLVSMLIVGSFAGALHQPPRTGCRWPWLPPPTWREG